MFKKAVCLATFVGACLSAQAPVPYLRDFCVKMQPGKFTEYAAMLHEVTAKVSQVRADEGKLAWWLAEVAVVPAGSSARCDYHLVSGYAGFPPEPSTPAETDAALIKAKVPNMTAVGMFAKRDSLSTLVSVDIWRGVAGVGSPQKGGYVRMNLYKANPVSEWTKLETGGWKPTVQAYSKDHPGIGWAAGELALAGGSGMHYNAMTVDFFPTWAAVGQGSGPITEVWPKVHPDLKIDDYMQKVGKVADRYKVELYQVTEMVMGK